MISGDTIKIIQKYTTMLEVAKYQNSLKNANTSYDKTLTVMENLEASINDLKYKQTDINQKIEMYNEIIKNNRNFMEYITRVFSHINLCNIRVFF